MHADLHQDPRIECHVVDIAEGRLDPAAAIEFVSDDAHGGIDVFIGRVRASSHGRMDATSGRKLMERRTSRFCASAGATSRESWKTQTPDTP